MIVSNHFRIPLNRRQTLFDHFENGFHSSKTPIPRKYTTFFLKMTTSNYFENETNHSYQCHKN